MVDQSTVGPPSPTPDGTTGLSLRGGRLGDLIVSNLHGYYAEAALRGSCFTLSLPATTTGVAAGNVTGAAAAASTNFALWNPPTSSVNLSLIKMWIGIISGTTVGGPLFHNMTNIVPTIASTLTNGALKNCNPARGGGFAMGVAVSAGTALTGGGALSVVRPSSLFFSAGTYASLMGSNGLEVIDGDIVVPPGFMWVPCFAAAGTSVLSSYGVMWDEVPI